MTPLADVLRGLASSFRDQAAQVEPYNAGAAFAWRRAADAVEQQVGAALDEALTLEQAAAESGLSAETLRKKVARGDLPNAGRRHAPRVKRGDLPSRGRRPTSTAGPNAFDPDAHALRLTRGA